MSALEEGGEVNDKVGELEKVSGAKASIWKSVANHMHARRMRITELFSIIDKDKNKVYKLYLFVILFERLFASYHICGMLLQTLTFLLFFPFISHKNSNRRLVKMSYLSS